MELDFFRKSKCDCRCSHFDTIFYFYPQVKFWFELQFANLRGTREIYKRVLGHKYTHRLSDHNKITWSDFFVETCSHFEKYFPLDCFGGSSVFEGTGSTLFSGGLFWRRLNSISRQNQKQTQHNSTTEKRFLQPTQSECIPFSVSHLSCVHLYICEDVASIVHTIPPWKKIEKRLIRICEFELSKSNTGQRFFLTNSYFAVGIIEKNP
jgi:hypothetical protein